MSERGYWVLLSEDEWRDLAEQCSPAWQMRIAQILEPVEITAQRNAARPVGSDKDGRLPTAEAVIKRSKRRGTRKTKRTEESI